MSDLEARIAEELTEHGYCPPHFREASMRCSCGQWSRVPSIDEAGFQHHRTHVAEMLTNVIRERDAATWESALNLMLDHGIIYDADLERLKKLNPYRSNDE